ncbi:MAG: MBL fold metallo-hydrolase [Calditerrivibrio sp.]|nr:MBL fold metallo-hydrolase [Calditerrivibrio sp.]
MIKILGCRGTIPVSGEHYRKYGGNTSSVYVPIDKNECLILDCGTGVTALNSAEFSGLSKINIFFSHLHWDHIIGLPILRALYSSKYSIDIYVEKKVNFDDPECFLRELFKPPFFPVTYQNLKAKISVMFVDVERKYEFCNVEVSAINGNHPDGSMVYKIVRNGYTAIYATDYEHTKESDSRLIEFSSNADFMLFDTTYLPDDYNGHFDGVSKAGWGHSTYLDGIRIAKSAGVKNLVLFHHNPEYTDTMIDEMWELSKMEFDNTICAYDGLTLY